MKITRHAAPLVWLAVLLCGCTALPEVGPFVDATIGLRSAVSTSGTAVEDELKRMRELWETNKNYAQQFENQWKERIKATDVLVAYANSLRDIVDAGNTGSASISKLIESVQGLANAAKITIPVSAEAVSTATDVAKFIYNQISLMRAAKSLEEALVRSQPAVERIVDILFKDLSDADATLLVAGSQIKKKMKTSINAELGFRTSLTKERRRLYEAWKDVPENETADQKRDRERREQRIQEVDALLTSTNAWHKPYEDRLKSVDERIAVGRKLIAAAQQGVSAWLEAYKQLTLAVKDRRPVNAESLTASAVEIRTLVEKVREL